MYNQGKLAQAEIAALRKAYEQAIYEVYDGQKTIEIKIGQNCPSLDYLIAQSALPTWALITAANPYSQPLSTPENQRRDQRLSKHLQGLELPLIPALGKDPTGVWSPEPSWLILGITRQKAIAIGQKFEQNAIVYGELNQAAELQWL